MPDPHHLAAPREIHAELTGAVLARELAEARVEPESLERHHDPASEPLEAWPDVKRCVRVGGCPGEGEGRLEEDRRMSTPGTALAGEVRGKQLPVRVSNLPFHPTTYKR